MFGTGTLLRTLIPRRRTGPYREPNGAVSGSASASVSVSTPPPALAPASRSILTQSASESDAFAATTAVVTGIEASPFFLHALCFESEAGEEAVSLARGTLESVFPSAVFHAVVSDTSPAPVSESSGTGMDTKPVSMSEQWPLPLIRNLRDAALVSSQFPDLYKPSDVVLFMCSEGANGRRLNGETSGYTLAGFAIACVARAKTSGISWGSGSGHASVTNTPCDTMAVRCDVMSKACDSLMAAMNDHVNAEVVNRDILIVLANVIEKASTLLKLQSSTQNSDITKPVPVIMYERLPPAPAPAPVPTPVPPVPETVPIPVADQTNPLGVQSVRTVSNREGETTYTAVY